MALPMRSTDFRGVVEPILNKVFDSIYNQRKDQWKPLFRTENGIPRNYHEEPVLFGFGAAPEMPEGTGINFDQGGQLFTARTDYKVYGNGFALTKVLVEDGEAVRIGKIYAEQLSQSLIETQETVAANIFNRAFNAAFAVGDNVAFVANNHVRVNGTYSNLLSTSAVLSQTSLEQMVIQVSKAQDFNGKFINLETKRLVVAPENMLQAEVITKSVLRTGGANNDLNPVQSMGLVPDGVSVVSRLTSPTAWWVQTSAQEKRGLLMLMRRAMERSMEGDFYTDSAMYKATMRYAPLVVDPKCYYGTPGT